MWNKKDCYGENSTKNTELCFGEAYRTTKSHTWSKYAKSFPEITVPKDALLIFRSFLPIKSDKNSSLALFVWLEKNIVICLSVGGLDCIFYVKHVTWEKRYTSLYSKPAVPSKKKAEKPN